VSIKLAIIKKLVTAIMIIGSCCRLYHRCL